jgi:pullulanase/glycogen debranching enzyme
MNKADAEREFQRRLIALREKFNAKQRQKFRDKKKKKRIQSTSKWENRGEK